MLDLLIAKLQSTTFFGHRLRCRQIADIHGVVRMFSQLNYTELGHTICTQPRWQTPKGRNRILRALPILDALEPLGILRLPPQRGGERPRQQPFN